MKENIGFKNNSKINELTTKVKAFNFKSFYKYFIIASALSLQSCNDFVKTKDLTSFLEKNPEAPKLDPENSGKLLLLETVFSVVSYSDKIKKGDTLGTAFVYNQQVPILATGDGGIYANLQNPEGGNLYIEYRYFDNTFHEIINGQYTTDKEEIINGQFNGMIQFEKFENDLRNNITDKDQKVREFAVIKSEFKKIPGWTREYELSFDESGISPKFEKAETGFTPLLINDSGAFVQGVYRMIDPKKDENDPNILQVEIKGEKHPIILQNKALSNFLDSKNKLN